MDKIPFYRSFRFRLVFLVVLTQVVFLGFSGVYWLRKQAQSDTHKAYASNEASLKVVASFVRNAMSNFGGNLDLMAVTPALGSFDPTESSKFLKSYKVSSLFITGEKVALYNNHNELVADNWMVGGGAENTSFKHFGTVEPLKVFIGETKWENFSPLRTFAVTVQNYARANGILTADFSFRRLYPFLSEFKVGAQGYLIVVDQEGNVVYHPDSKWTKSPHSISEMGLTEFDIKTHTITEPTYITLQDGQSYMINYMYETEAQLGVLTLLPSDEIAAQTSSTRHSMLLVYGLMMVAMVVLITWLATLQLRPLVALTQKMRLVQNGNLDVDSGIQREDEIGLLAAVFDTMRASIKQYIGELGDHRDRLELEVAERTAELEKANKILELMSRTDDLTGIPNRRDIMEKIKYEMRRSNRNKLPFAFVLGDIDKFKNFNDTYGHNCGDEVLRSVAQTMRSLLRKHDYIARWGGEEFLLVLPETHAEGAMVVAQRVRAQVAESKYVYGENELSVTITLGVSMFDNRLGIERSISLADKALYEGKEQGRNRVVFWDPERITAEELTAAAKEQELRDSLDVELPLEIIHNLDQERQKREQQNEDKT